MKKKPMAKGKMSGVEGSRLDKSIDKKLGLKEGSKLDKMIDKREMRKK